MQAATFVQSVGASAFTAFGLVALAIAAIGLHGVVAQYVAERRREIAVTVALGATPAMVAGAVVRPALWLTAGGLIVGIALTAAAGALVRSQLVGVNAIDAVSIGGAAIALVLTGLGSCAWPVRRAMRMDFVSTIRTE